MCDDDCMAEHAVEHPAEHAAQQLVVAEGLFTWPSDAPQLIGSYFPESGVTTFPQSGSCPKTSSRVVEQVLLPRRGTLWSWTVQAFLPKNPPYAGTETAKDFVPYGVGYVQLADQVVVESRLTINDPAQLKIGMELEMVVIPFAVDAEGRELLTYAFAPVAPESKESGQ
jgi:uncharacterized OB-fold protein